MTAKGADSWTALHFAAKAGHVKIVDELLSIAEVELEAKSEDLKRTALHVAAEFGHVKIVELLV